MAVGRTKNVESPNNNANSTNGLLYRGIVENNQDPYKLGRVQIRIPEFYGIEGSTETASYSSSSLFSVQISSSQPSS